MFRISIFLTIALAIAAMGSTPTQARALYLHEFSNEVEMPTHLHSVPSPGKTMFRPPSKKRPL